MVGNVIEENIITPNEENGTNENALETIEEAMGNMERERLTKEITEIHTSLTNALNNKQLGAIEEPVFMDYFVKPIAKWMAGVDLTEQEQYRLNKYMEISGSVYDPVEITDHYGNVLLLAPPLMEKPELTEDNTQNNYYKLVKAYNIKYNRVPQEASAYINGKLATLKPIIYAPSGQIVKDWISLIELYNARVDGKDKNKTTTRQETKQETSGKEDYGIEY